MAGTEQNCERAAGDWTIFDDDVLVDIFRHDRRLLPRGRFAGSDSPAPKRDRTRSGEREAAPAHGMPNHGSVTAMPPPNGRVSTGCSASRVLRLRELYLPPPVHIRN